MQTQSRYQLRYAAGAYWLLDMEQPGMPYKKPMMLNECGAYIWQQMDRAETLSSIAAKLHERYEVPEDVACGDVEQFMLQLQAHGVLLELEK